MSLNSVILILEGVLRRINEAKLSDYVTIEQELRVIHKILAHMKEQQKSQGSVIASSVIRARPTEIVSQMTMNF